MSEWNRHLAPSIFSVVENMTLGHKKWTEECTDTAAPRIHRVQQVKHHVHLLGTEECKG
ncbi:hypothetical protein J6590_034494 [Homalodisca vitripennis]|nr:hypothetical protein J6590_034494 [Homalodisca vitripennis]